MQTRLPESLLATADGQEADAILRSCVHCGFCTATCPTYQLLGDELDGPRGRIYLIKQALEQQQASRRTLQHLDRCLQCRNCETTCPSGVRYTRLLEIGKQQIERRVARPARQSLFRKLLVLALPHRNLNYWFFHIAHRLRPLLPQHLARHLPASLHPARFPATRSTEKHVVLFQGCVESTLMGNAQRASARLLEACGYSIRTLPQEQCCGAVEHHLAQTQRARQRALTNLDTWKQALDEGAEAVIMLSSACLLETTQYPDLLQQRAPDYMQDVLQKVMGLEAWLLQQNMQWTTVEAEPVAWHSPCTLQHGLKQADRIPRLLSEAGYEVLLPQDAHLCCGAAGTYTLLQNQLSQQLGQQRIQALLALGTGYITTANIGCLLQLQAGDPHNQDPGISPEVLHWTELLARRLPD